MSKILVRTVTLALRLFANMCAGHMLLILFALGGQYLIVEMAGAYSIVGVVAWLLFILISFLDLFIHFLQAYVLVLLNAMYLQGSLADAPSPTPPHLTSLHPRIQTQTNQHKYSHARHHEPLSQHYTIRTHQPPP